MRRVASNPLARSASAIAPASFVGFFNVRMFRYAPLPTTSATFGARRSLIVPSDWARTRAQGTGRKSDPAASPARSTRRRIGKSGFIGDLLEFWTAIDAARPTEGGQYIARPHKSKPMPMMMGTTQPLGGLGPCRGRRRSGTAWALRAGAWHGASKGPRKAGPSRRRRPCPGGTRRRTWAPPTSAPLPRSRGASRARRAPST